MQSLIMRCVSRNRFKMHKRRYLQFFSHTSEQTKYLKCWLFENSQNASRTAQSALAGQMWPAGRVFETTDLHAHSLSRSSLSTRGGWKQSEDFSLRNRDAHFSCPRNAWRGRHAHRKTKCFENSFEISFLVCGDRNVLLCLVGWKQKISDLVNTKTKLNERSKWF